LRFDTLEEAEDYARRHNIPYRVYEPKEPARRQIAYADNFSYRRKDLWTH
jgi:hypothetical protein